VKKKKKIEQMLFAWFFLTFSFLLCFFFQDTVHHFNISMKKKQKL